MKALLLTITSIFLLSFAFGNDEYTIKNVKDKTDYRFYTIRCNACGENVYLKEYYKSGDVKIDSFWGSSTYGSVRSAAMAACDSKCD